MNPSDEGIGDTFVSACEATPTSDRHSLNAERRILAGVLNESSREVRWKENATTRTPVSPDIASMTALLREAELRHGAYELRAATHD